MNLIMKKNCLSGSSKIITAVILFFMAFEAGIAQQKQLRIEIEAKSESDAYNIIPFGNKGVLLFFKYSTKGDRLYENYNFTMYSTSFKELWEQTVNIKTTWQYHSYKYIDEKLYMLFQKPYLSNKTPILLLTMDVNKGTYTTNEYDIPAKSVIRGFELTKNHLFIGGRTEVPQSTYCFQTCFNMFIIPLIFDLSVINIDPVMFIIDRNSGKGEWIPANLKKNGMVENIQLIDSNKVSYMVNTFIKRNKQKILIYDIGANGSIENTTSIDEINDKKIINDARFCSLGNNEKLIIGTYSRGKYRSNRGQAKLQPASGIYFAKGKGNSITYIKYHNFSVFKNLFNSMSAKAAAKTKKSIQKAQAKGKEFFFEFNILFHDIIVKNNQYIVVGELYYPEFRTVHYYTYDAYGRPILQTYQVFAGYRYTQALIACFDNDGNLLWDNQFNIKKILTFNLKERVKLIFDKDDIILVYCTDGKIASKIIRGSEVIEGDDFSKIETKYQDDKLIDDMESDIEYWYDNYYITYGYQRIKNRTQPGKNKRTVFYFSKIAFQ